MPTNLLLRLLHICLFIFASLFANAQLVINEVSNGTNPLLANEYIELVVIGLQGTMVDLRGMIVDDNSGFWLCSNSAGIASGHIRFAQIDNWKCIPTGSIILLYNQINKNPSITLSDDSTDVNGDFVYVLPVGAPGMFEVQNSSPNISSCTTFTGALAPALAVDWNKIQLNDTVDGVTIVDPSSVAFPVHQISYGVGVPVGSRSSLHFTSSGLGSVFINNNSNFNLRNNWIRGTAPMDETPGSPNTLANSNWIESLQIRIDASPDTLCAPGNVAFFPHSSYINFIWDFGDGSIPVGGKFPAAHQFNAGLFKANVAITAPNGCVYVDTVLITALRNRPFNIITDTVCINDTARVGVSGGGAANTFYYYTDSSSTIPFASGRSLDIYGINSDTTFWVSSLGGLICMDSSKFPIQIMLSKPGNILPQVISDTICVGDTAKILAFGSGPGAKYTWFDTIVGGNFISNVDSIQLIGITRDTSFYVTSGDGTVCSNNSRVEARIIVNPVNQLPQTNFNVICIGDSAVIKAFGAGPLATYTWYLDSLGGTSLFNGDSIILYNILQDTVLYVSSGDSSDCSNDERVKAEVRVNPVLAKASGRGDTICVGDMAILQANIFGPISSFEWFGDTLSSAPISTANIFRVPNLVNDTAFYLRNSPSLLCADSGWQIVPVSVHPTFARPVVLNDTICQGDTARLNILFADPLSTYSWYTNASTSSTSHLGTSLALVGLTSDTVIFVNRADRRPCVDTSRLAVGIRIRPHSNLPPQLRGDTVCIGDTAVLYAFGAGPLATYSWFTSQNGGAIIHVGDSIQLFSIASDTTFWVSTGDSTNCTNNSRYAVRARVGIISNTPPNVFGDVICLGEIARLRANGGGSSPTYTWYSSQNGGAVVHTGSNWNLSGLTTDTAFFVTTGDGTICSDNTRVRVNVVVNRITNRIPTAFGDSICLGEGAILRAINGGPAVTYTWFDQATGGSVLGTGSIIVLSGLTSSTIAFVTSGDGSNCSNNGRAKVKITVLDSVSSSIVCEPETIDSNKIIRFTYKGQIPYRSISWMFDGINSPVFSGESIFHAFLDTGYHEVFMIVHSRYGCLDTVRKQIYVGPYSPNTVFVPNAFSPNDDGSNDLFEVKGNNIESFVLEVYDRWGALLFRSTDINNSWDGTLGGSFLKPGVYTYQLSVVFKDRNRKKSKGMIHLLN